MADSPNDNLKAEELSKELEEASEKVFLASLKEYRKIYGTRYKNKDEIDSEVSLFLHSMIIKFDNYRNNVS